jgi:hypothetical protein
MVERLGSATDRDLELASSDGRAVSGLAMRELGRREGRREADAEFAELREQARWPEFVFVVAPVGVIANIVADPATGKPVWIDDGNGGHSIVITDEMAKAAPAEIAIALGVVPRLVAHLRVSVVIIRGGEAVAGEWLNMSAVIAPSSIGMPNMLGRLAGQLIEAARAIGRQHSVFPPPDLDQIIAGVVQVIDANKERIAAMPVDADALGWMLSGAGTVLDHDEPRGVQVSIAAAEQAARDTRRDGMTRLVLVDSGSRKIEITALRPARPRPTGRLAEPPIDAGQSELMQLKAELADINKVGAELAEVLGEGDPDHPLDVLAACVMQQLRDARSEVVRLQARIAELVGQLEGQAHEGLVDPNVPARINPAPWMPVRDFAGLRPAPSDGWYWMRQGDAVSPGRFEAGRFVTVGSDFESWTADRTYVGSWIGETPR